MPPCISTGFGTKPARVDRNLWQTQHACLQDAKLFSWSRLGSRWARLRGHERQRELLSRQALRFGVRVRELAHTPRSSVQHSPGQCAGLRCLSWWQESLRMHAMQRKGVTCASLGSAPVCCSPLVSRHQVSEYVILCTFTCNQCGHSGAQVLWFTTVHVMHVQLPHNFSLFRDRDKPA